ncbi:MAG: hypothetical protein IPM97_09845 [Bdellovibrionaceae bacterium]|nr:hypothetical protein [Pseudobdellovibrionaceae bacterium]
MKAFIKNILTVSIILFVTTVAKAQYGRGGSSNERSGGYYTGSSAYGSSVSFGHSNEIITNFSRGTLYSGKSTTNGSSVTTIDIQGKYLRVWNANVQVGGMVGLYSTSGGVSRTLLTALGIGIYNFDTNIKQAFFAEGGVGIYPVLNSAGDYDSKFGFYIGGGKRFPIWERVSYIPSASLVKKGDLDFAFDIQFINFSIMF